MRVDLTDVFTAETHEPPWIVKNVIPAKTIVMVAGDAGVGKTSMNLAEGLHVALGRVFLGHPTVRTKVLYLDEENSRPDLYAYLQQLWVGLGRPTHEELDPWFRVEHFSLSREWAGPMTKIVAEWQPGMIYVDTASAAFHVKDENDNAEASRIIHDLRYVMQASHADAALKIIKHAKYQNQGGQRDGAAPRRTIRGAKAWLGAVDQTMYHIRAGRGRPPKHGLSDTILVPDKSRAWGLKGNIGIFPSYTADTPKGLILRGEPLETDQDLMAADV